MKNNHLRKMACLLLWIILIPVIAVSNTAGSTQITYGQGSPDVTIQLKTLTVEEKNESSDDEPYFVVIGFTSRYKTPNSTRTFWSGELYELEVEDAGDTIQIPANMGLISFEDVDLVSVDDIAEGRQLPEVIGAVVVSLESDATPFGAIRDKMEELQSAVEVELKRLVEGGELNIAELNEEVVDEAVQNIKDATVGSFWEDFGLWLESFGDPDDQMGFYFLSFLAVDADLDGYVLPSQGEEYTFAPLSNVDDLELTFNDDGTYRVSTSVITHATDDTIEPLDCEPAYEEFSQAFLPAINAGHLSISSVIPDYPETNLDVLQYNVQFLTPWNEGEIDTDHWPNVSERAKAIGQAIACNDIVGLNETINDLRRAEILDGMNEFASNCGKPNLLSGSLYFGAVSGPSVISPDVMGVTEAVNAVLERPGEPVFGDELMIVSRLPIISTDSHIYQSHLGIDSLTAKGVLYARLQPRPDSIDYIDVFSTHLQAGEDDSEVRKCQVAELMDFIREKAEPDIPILLMGDFNINGLIDEGTAPESEYLYLMNAFHLLGTGHSLTDIGVGLNKGTNQDDNPSEHRSERIDYIFLSQPRLVLNDDNVSVLEFEDSRWETLSDHAGVGANLTWRRSDRPDLVLSSFQVVDSLISLKISNLGSTAVTEPFWVDLYIDPQPIPTSVNHIWGDGRSRYGAVWGVIEDIQPGESLMLSINDTYYWPSLSDLPDHLSSNTPIYVQVDSANELTSYGGVFEIHERDGDYYNNISGPYFIDPLSGYTLLGELEIDEATDSSDLPVRGQE